MLVPPFLDVVEDEEVPEMPDHPGEVWLFEGIVSRGSFASHSIIKKTKNNNSIYMYCKMDILIGVSDSDRLDYGVYASEDFYSRIYAGENANNQLSAFSKGIGETQYFHLAYSDLDFSLDPGLSIVDQIGGSLGGFVTENTRRVGVADRGDAVCFAGDSKSKYYELQERNIDTDSVLFQGNRGTMELLPQTPEIHSVRSITESEKYGKIVCSVYGSYEQSIAIGCTQGSRVVDDRCYDAWYPDGGSAVLNETQLYFNEKIETIGDILAITNYDTVKLYDLTAIQNNNITGLQPFDTLSNVYDFSFYSEDVILYIDSGEMEVLKRHNITM